MTDQPELPRKQDVASNLLGKGTVFVHLDPRSDSVVVPSWLKEQPQLVLQVGLNMPIPIPDLRVDDRGLFGTLSFNRHPFTCRVPWETVFAVVGDDGRGMVWPESMPAEIAAEVDREAARNSVPIPRAEDSSPALQAVEPPPFEGIRDSKRPIPARTDAELPAGSFRVRSRAPELPDYDETPSMGPVSEAGSGPSSSRPPSRPSSRPRGRVQLPPYMRVIK